MGFEWGEGEGLIDCIRIVSANGIELTSLLEQELAERTQAHVTCSRLDCAYREDTSRD